MQLEGVSMHGYAITVYGHDIEADGRTRGDDLGIV
jgi:hypothetical protein